MVLEAHVPTLVYSSPKEATVDLYFGQVGEKCLMVPVDTENSTIITVRPMRRTERAVYGKEVSHEEE